jgi:hypothetical protein
MNTPTKTAGTLVAAVALALAIAGCGSDSEKQAASSSAESSNSTSSSSQSSAPRTSAAPAGKRETIADYIKANGITETPVKKGQPGTPRVDLPVPAGWQDAGPKTPQFAYSAMLFTGDPAMAADPPTIVALMSKLTGNVDPAKIAEYAPGELQNLPGFQGGGAQKDELGGFEAYQVGGSYLRDGVTRMIAQKTVIIPSGPDLFVLQVNADGLENQMGPLMDATATLDDKTVITP